MKIPVELLLDSSVGLIGEYELSRLNMAANLRKEMRATAETIIDCLAEARFARWLIEHREELRGTAGTLHVAEEVFDFGNGKNRKAGSAQTRLTDRFEADAAD